jgi:RNA polymerase sigma-70 factor, ECF subfamily
MSPLVHDPSPLGDPGRDGALVERVRAGDEAAFELIFREHAHALLNFAFHYTGSADDAEDIVQTVFARVWIGRERWGVRGSLAAYLKLATRNLIRDRARHAQVVERHRAGVLPSVAAGPDAALDAAETAAAIQHAIESLAPQRRAVFMLRWAQGLSYAEIATKLRLAEKTVERHLTLAYKELRERISNLPLGG